MKPPMTRRWCLWLCLPLLLVALFLVPGVHWHLIGWVRGEPFCEGMPASWWDREVDARYSLLVFGSRDVAGVTNTWMVERPASVWSQLGHWLMPGIIDDDSVRGTF